MHSPTQADMQCFCNTDDVEYIRRMSIILGRLYTTHPAIAYEAIAQLSKPSYSIEELTCLVKDRVSVSFDNVLVYVQNNCQILKNLELSIFYKPKTITVYADREMLLLEFEQEVLLNRLPLEKEQLLAQLFWKQSDLK